MSKLVLLYILCLYIIGPLLDNYYIARSKICTSSMRFVGALSELSMVYNSERINGQPLTDTAGNFLANSSNASPN